MGNDIIETAEFILPGHPDKLCDAVVDGIVDYIGRNDPEGQCGLEAACVFGSIYLTGRIAAREAVLHELDIGKIVRETYASAGYGADTAGHEWKPSPAGIAVTTNLCFGPFEEGERELRHLSDDQAICVGYASDLEECDFLPPAHWFANRIGRELAALRLAAGAGEVGPDGKVAVRVRRDGAKWRPLHVSISLNHHEGSDWLRLRRLAEAAVEAACGGRPVPNVVLNGAGMFVAGGPNGDNGLSGKKLVVDAYGPTVPIGGGAWSGKDFNKVDRVGGLLARDLAKSLVLAGRAREARVTLEYNPGCDRPVAVHAVLDGKRHLAGVQLTGVGGLALDNRSATRHYQACEAALPELARWGHFRPGLPWEEGRFAAWFAAGAAAAGGN